MRISFLFFLLMAVFSMDASAQTFKRLSTPSTQAYCNLKSKVTILKRMSCDTEINVHPESRSSVKSVELYIDNKLVGKDYTYPFIWRKETPAPGYRKFKVVVKGVCNYVNTQSKTVQIEMCPN